MSIYMYVYIVITSVHVQSRMNFIHERSLFGCLQTVCVEEFSLARHSHQHQTMAGISIIQLCAVATKKDLWFVADMLLEMFW